jgi:integrase
MRITTQPLEIEQARTFLEAAKGHPLEGLFILALATGLRRGELLGLQWQDVDVEKKVLYVRRAILALP